MIVQKLTLSISYKSYVSFIYSKQISSQSIDMMAWWNGAMVARWYGDTVTWWDGGMVHGCTVASWHGNTITKDNNTKEPFPIS